VTAAHVSRDQRHLRSHPCPVCGGFDEAPRGKEKRCHGFTTIDDRGTPWTNCARAELAGSINQNRAGLYAHKMLGPCKCGATHAEDLRPKGDEIESTYDYRDEHGALLFQVVRKTGKRFLQRVPDGDGGWIWKLNGVRRVLYRLPEIVADDADRTIYIAEGEKDVDTLSRRGFLATTNPGGAGKFALLGEHPREVLRGRDVIVIADADEPGRKHAREVEGILRDVVRSIKIVEAPPPHKDVSDLFAAGGGIEQLVEKAANDTASETTKLRSLGELFAPAIERAERRAQKLEMPIPLPWSSCEEQFGGGLWPGMHVLNAGTGTGKTAAALQVAGNAAKLGIPVLYIGLELEDMQIALRVLGQEAHVPWSHLYLGKAGPAYIERAKEAAAKLGGAPFYVELSRPHGWPASELGRVAEQLRSQYPGESPCLVVVDFLQLIGPEPDESRSSELRERVGRAAYAARDIARRLNMAVLVISSIARDKLRNLANVASEAGLTWISDDAGRPLKRGILNPDALIGIGKESGDIEYAADSVTAIFRVPGTWREGVGTDVIVATAKGRATGPGWSPLLFTGFGYVEPEDGGARIVDALTERGKAKSDAKAEREATKEREARDDAVKVARFVLGNPGCSGREAKENVARNETRWKRVRDKLGPSLSAEPPLHFDINRAPAFVRVAIQGGDADV